jgi:hypothetical protein
MRVLFSRFIIDRHCREPHKNDAEQSGGDHGSWQEPHEDLRPKGLPYGLILPDDPLSVGD